MHSPSKARHVGRHVFTAGLSGRVYSSRFWRIGGRPHGAALDLRVRGKRHPDDREPARFPVNLMGYLTARPAGQFSAVDLKTGAFVALGEV